MHQTKNADSSDLESTKPAVVVENDAALSKTNQSINTNSTETDSHSPEKHSPVTKKPDRNSNVTLVGTDDAIMAEIYAYHLDGYVVDTDSITCPNCEHKFRLRL